MDETIQTNSVADQMAEAHMVIDAAESCSAEPYGEGVAIEKITVQTDEDIGAAPF